MSTGVIWYGSKKCDIYFINFYLQLNAIHLIYNRLKTKQKNSFKIKQLNVGELTYRGNINKTVRPLSRGKLWLRMDADQITVGQKTLCRSRAYGMWLKIVFKYYCVFVSGSKRVRNEEAAKEEDVPQRIPKRRDDKKRISVETPYLSRRPNYCIIHYESISGYRVLSLMDSVPNDVRC